MTSSDEQRARDALAFEPLPPSNFVSVSEDAIVVAVRYSERLSNLLREIPGAHWIPQQRQWQYPFSAADHIRRRLPEIERLALMAQESAERETARREDDRLERERAAEEARKSRENRARLAREREMLSSPPRPFRREFLMPVNGAPIYVLSIEAIGDDTRKALSRFGFKAWSGWVAQLFGSCPQRRWQRSFLRGQRDYRKANSVGSRGIMVNYFLEQGPIYEVYERTSWRDSDRYFLRIAGGIAVRMTEAEVRQCLER